MMAANLAGMVMLQNSFHQARGIITMPLSSALSNLVPIVGGMLAFGEGLLFRFGCRSDGLLRLRLSQSGPALMLSRPPKSRRSRGIKSAEPAG